MDVNRVIEYAERGWPVFPVKAGLKRPLTKHGLKDASTDPDKIRQWWKAWPDANVGIRTGAASNIFVVDVDVKNGAQGKEHCQELRLPETLISKTPTGGFHYIYKYPGYEIRNRTNLRPGIDIRGDEGYIVAPPSIVGGQSYEWIYDEDVAPASETLLRALKRPQSPTANGNGTHIPEGQRNDYLAKLAGVLRGQAGLSQEGLEAALLVENKACDPPLPEAEVRRIAASIARYPSDAPVLPGTVDDWPAPEVLPDEKPPVAAFDSAWLPTTIKGWAEDVAERMQVPIDFPAVASMVVFGSLIGRQVCIRPKERDDWEVTPNLWGVVIARSGLMKTPALNETFRFIRQLETFARERHEERLQSYEHGKTEAEAQKSVAAKKYRTALEKGEDARMAEVVIPDKPSRGRYLVNDSTVEKLGELLNQNPNGLLLVRDELIGFIRSLEREGHQADRAFYLEAWNGDSSFVYDRISRGTVDIPAACISILGGIQPGPLLKYMRAGRVNDANDDGLLQRFQLMVWPEMPKDWQDIDRRPGQHSRNEMDRLALRFSKLDTSGLETSAVGTPFVRFDEEALDIFRNYRAGLEARLRSGDLHPLIESHLSKYRSLVPSLALIAHVLERSGPVSSDVGFEAIDKAIRWANYLETHANRIYDAVVHQDMDAAKLLAKKIEKGGVPQVFAVRDIYRKCWSGLADPETVERAAAVLVDFDWLAPRQEATKGRTRLVYEVNPRVYTR